MRTSAKTNQSPIVITRGIYDLLKTFINSNKLSKYNEDKLDEELKLAKQVLRKDIPAQVVDLDKKVRVKELESGTEFEFHFVRPQKARKKHNTISILSPIGVALLGYKEGEKLSWEMPEGIKSYQVLSVSPVA